MGTVAPCAPTESPLVRSSGRHMGSSVESPCILFRSPAVCWLSAVRACDGFYGSLLSSALVQSSSANCQSFWPSTSGHQQMQGQQCSSVVVNPQLSLWFLVSVFSLTLSLLLLQTCTYPAFLTIV